MKRALVLALLLVSSAAAADEAWPCAPRMNGLFPGSWPYVDGCAVVVASAPTTAARTFTLHVTEVLRPEGKLTRPGDVSATWGRLEIGICGVGEKDPEIPDPTGLRGQPIILIARVLPGGELLIDENQVYAATREDRAVMRAMIADSAVLARVFRSYLQK
jgi:hypothetical protein